MLFGALSKAGVLHFSYIIPLAIVAVFIHDSVFWYIGARLKKLEKKKFWFMDFEKMEVFLEKMKPTAGIYVFISKFVWNFNRIILISAGYAGITYKRFIKFSIVSGILWSFAYTSIGFVFADQTDLFKQRLEVVGLLLVGIIALIVIFEVRLKKLVQKYLYNGSPSNKITPPSQK